jgi:hypothetical protein
MSKQNKKVMNSQTKKELVIFRKMVNPLKGGDTKPTVPKHREAGLP